MARRGLTSDAETLSVRCATLTAMTTTPTGDTAVLDRPRHDFATEQPKVAHIVTAEGDKTGRTRVTEARVFGTVIEALCGYRWIPGHPADGLPVCQKCVELWDKIGGTNPEGLNCA